MSDDRLLSLEAAVREIAVSAAQVATGQEHVLRQVDAGLLVANRLEEKFDKLDGNVRDLDHRIKPLEEDLKKSGRKVEAIKRLIWPALAATAGVFGAKFGATALEAIGTYFGK